MAVLRPDCTSKQLGGHPHAQLPIAVGQNDGEAPLAIWKTNGAGMIHVAAGRLQRPHEYAEVLRAARVGELVGFGQLDQQQTKRAA